MKSVRITPGLGQAAARGRGAKARGLNQGMQARIERQECSPLVERLRARLAEAEAHARRAHVLLDALVPESAK